MFLHFFFYVSICFHSSWVNVQELNFWVIGIGHIDVFNK